MPLRRTVAALAAGPLLLVGVAACGNNSGSDAKASDPAGQSSNGSTGLTAGQQVAPADFVKTVSAGLEKSTTAHMTMTIDAGATGKMTAQGDIDYTSKPPAMQMTMALPTGASGGAASGQLDMRLVNGIIYMSMGQLTQGKYWKIDPSDPNGPFAAMGMGQLMDQMDPAKAFQNMKNAITKAVYVGSDNGMDHYRLTVDMKKAIESMGTKLPAEAQSQLPDSVTYDVWLDDQGRFSKMSMDKLPMGGTSGSMEMTLTDWGKDVSIQAPPADQITKMPNFGSMMGGSSSAPAA